jgi:hypothetical protein
MANFTLHLDIAPGVDASVLEMSGGRMPIKLQTSVTQAAFTPQS